VGRSELEDLEELLEKSDEEVRETFRSIKVKIDSLEPPRVDIGSFWPSADKKGIYLLFLILNAENRDVIIRKELYSYYFLKLSNINPKYLPEYLKDFSEMLLSILAKGYKDDKTILKCLKLSIKNLESAYISCNDYVSKIYSSL
jgi:hypothetical protein